MAEHVTSGYLEILHAKFHDGTTSNKDRATPNKTKKSKQAQRRAATETVARKLIDPLYIHWVHI